jgi:hypothetical protein
MNPRAEGLPLLLVIFYFMSFFTMIARFRRGQRLNGAAISRIGSTASGYVAITGETRPLSGKPAIEPITATPCVWWRLRVEARSNFKWKTIRQTHSKNWFVLADGDQECLIAPDIGRLTGSPVRRWRGNETAEAAITSAAREADSESGRYRYTLDIIPAGASVTAWGELENHADLKQEVDRVQRSRILRWATRGREQTAEALDAAERSNGRCRQALRRSIKEELIVSFEQGYRPGNTYVLQGSGWLLAFLLMTGLFLILLHLPKF